MQQKQAEAARSLPCVKRRYLLSGGAFVLTMVGWLAIVAIIVVMVAKPANGGMPPLLNQAMRFAFAPVILAAIVIWIVNRRWETQLKITARKAECRLCPRCTYDLNDTISDENVRCPECGEVMNLDEVEKLWRAWMG